MQYRLIKGGHPRDFITGKPVALGGLAERTVSTGYGGYYVLEKLLLEYLKAKRLIDTTVAVQGFGKVGYWFAEIAAKQGMKVVAISNEFGGAYNPNGLDVEKTRTALGGNGGRGWCNVDGEEINNDAILELDVDVLVPAAIENVITEENADRVKAKVVLELANGPTTNEADQIMNDKGIWVVPDIIANAGGVVVSYYEWLANRHGEEKTHDQIMSGLQTKMTDATDKMMTRHLEKGMRMRTAAYALALKRIGEAKEALGTKTYFGPMRSGV